VSLHKDPRLGRDLRKWAGYAAVRPYLADSALERCVEQWMFSLDPPDHTRLRRLVARAFTPKAVEAMRFFIEQAADELLDELEATGRPGEIDLMSSFAQPFPVRVIARILGLTVDDYPALKRWSDDIALVLEPTARRKQKQSADASVIEMTEYLREQAKARRAAPGSDVLSELLRAEEEGERLTEGELLAQLIMLFVAGHETTSNLLGNGMLALCREPEVLADLRAHTELIPNAVEEMLRYDGPANTNGRVAHVDIEVGGCTIPAGSVLLCMLGSANRDPEVFADPDRFDIRREKNPHVSFGGGVHHCLGHALGKLEAQVALERLLTRFSRIEVDEVAVSWRDLVNVRGMSRLGLRVAWA
jgi:pimeloyl-[acyl-carrier protein] synthase